MLFDLTQPVTDELPVYPGDPAVSISQIATIPNDGYAVSGVSIGTHTGTHLDAAAHMIEGGKQLKDYPIERFVLRVVCVDVREGFDTGKIAGQLVPGAGVVFYTGASDYFTEERYWHEYQVPDKATVQLLIDHKVPLVGIDAGSFDTDETFPVHKALLAADMLLIENLTNLAPLIGKQFDLYAFPMKLEGDGAPVRVVARTM
jgi:kynurenine formamidase